MVEQHTAEGEPTEIIKLSWMGYSSATAQDSVDPMSAAEKNETAEAAKMLVDFLGDSVKPASECEQFPKDSGVDFEKVNVFRVRQKAGVDTRRQPHGNAWEWYGRILYGTGKTQ